jgi:excinuclease UvrABC nuclease subunit
MEKWKDDLKSIFEAQQVDKSGEKKADEVRSQVKKFFSGKVKPVFKKLKKELEKYDREVNIAIGDHSGAIEVINQGQLELDFKVKVRDIFPYPETLYQDVSGNRIWGEVSFREGIQKYSIYDIPEDVILENFLREYKSRLWALSKEAPGKK